MQEDLILVNIYETNIRICKYTKQILTDIKEKIDNDAIIVGDLNISLTSMNR